MADIAFHEVTKRYEDGTQAVTDLSLEVADGEFMILVGPSGCGKSTALRMVAGLEEISSGELLIDGEVVNDAPPKDRDIAMVFQNYALYANMTVRDNMGFALRVAKVPKAEIRSRVEAAATVLDLTDHLERKPARLSGGQRQRVAMGRAIVREPRVFLMDEPLSNLDAKLRVQMRGEISRLQSRLATTTLYVTHDQTEAMTLGSRVAVMRHGLIQQVGAPDDLYEHPANLFVAGFIGSPPMTFVRAEVADDALRLPFATVPLDAGLRRALDGTDRRDHLVAGIRPEDISDIEGPVTGGRPAAIALDVTVDVIERMGSESLAYFDAGGDLRLQELVEIADDSAMADGSTLTRGQVIARIDGRTRLRSGDTARLWLAPDRLHLFDEATGAALR
jgi:multiple sugar transport system ATP-binding protein